MDNGKVLVSKRVLQAMAGIMVGMLLALIAIVILYRPTPQKSGNGCSGEFPYLLLESAVVTRYYIQGDQVIQRATGEIVPAQNAQGDYMWVLRSPAERYICISEAFFVRLRQEIGNEGMPFFEYPESDV